MPRGLARHMDGASLAPTAVPFVDYTVMVGMRRSTGFQGSH